MSKYSELVSLCSKHKVGTISIKNAHIFFHPSYVKGDPKPCVFVLPFDSRLQPKLEIDGKDIHLSTTGACLASWDSTEEHVLLDTLKEMLIELSMQGGDMQSMILQMLKIKEFAALGSESYNLARAFSKAVFDKSLEDLNFWSRYK